MPLRSPRSWQRNGDLAEGSRSRDRAVASRPRRRTGAGRDGRSPRSTASVRLSYRLQGSSLAVDSLPPHRGGKSALFDAPCYQSLSLRDESPPVYRPEPVLVRAPGSKALQLSRAAPRTRSSQVRQIPLGSSGESQSSDRG